MAATREAKGVGHDRSPSGHGREHAQASPSPGGRRAVLSLPWCRLLPALESGPASSRLPWDAQEPVRFLSHV